MRVALPLLVLTPFTAAAFTDGLADFSLKDTVRNMPGMLKDNVRRFRVGCGEMWVNGKAAGVVRQRVQSGGSALNYEELQLLRRSGEDTAKLLKAGALWLFAPELFPVLLYFYPRALPSTFETEAGRERRRGTLARMRTTSALELLATIEEQRASATGRKALAAVEHCATAEQVLRASSASRALAYVQGSAVAIAPDAKTYKAYSQIAQREAKRRSRKNAKVKVGVTTGAGKVALNGLSQPALKAGCKLIGVCGPQPGPFRRGALGAHLEKLVHEDSILAVQGVQSLEREELLEACLDRGVGSTALSDAHLRKLLEQWLQLVKSRGDPAVGGTGGDFEPHRLRLATMASCATSAVRREADSMSTLPRLVYAR